MMALIGLPIVAFLFPGLKDKGIGVARVVGLLLVAYPVWLFSHWLPLFGTPLIVGVFIFWGLIAVLLFYIDFKNWDRALLHPKELFVSELVWLGAFLLLAWIRSFNPEIEGMWKGGGSEKFMDLNFINSILMSREFPPGDNWFHGFPINYYYYGYYLCAVMIKLTGVLPHVGYNLMTVTVYALAINGLWSLLRNLNCKMVWSALGVFLAFLATNLKSALLAFTIKPAEEVMLVWRSSRVIDLDTDRTINEFPWFSFLWNDLHGHLSALPIEVGILALCWGAIVSLGSVGFGRLVLQALFLAVAYGSLVVTNAWDLPCYAAVIAISLLAAHSMRDWFRPWKREGVQRLAFQLVILCVALVAVFKVLFHGFFENFVPPTSGHNPVPWEMKSPLDLFLLIFGGILGVMILPLLGAVFQPVFRIFLKGKSEEKKSGNGMVWAILLITLTVQVGGSVYLGSKVGGFGPAMTPILLFNLLVLAVVWLLVSWWRRPPQTTGSHETPPPNPLPAQRGGGTSSPSPHGGEGVRGRGFEGERRGFDNGPICGLVADRYVALLLCLGLGLVLGCEFVAVKDFYGGSSLRLNTVFKFHSQAWILLALVSAYLTNRFLNTLIQAIKSDTPGKPVFIIGLLAHCTVILAVVGWTALGSWSILSTKTSGFENRPTLNGLAYAFPENRGTGHRAMSEDDARALLWLLDLQRFDYDPDRVILEYSGNPYSNDGRVSTFSGIPTLMAVANHEGIWNRKKKEAMTEKDRRKRVVQSIYSSPDFTESKRLMEEFGVTHVFFGTIERNKYGDNAKQRFDKYMEVAKQFGNTVVYSGFSDVPIERALVPNVEAQPLNNLTIIQSPDHPLQEPRGVAVGTNGEFYVCNSKSGTVDLYTPEGVFMRRLGSAGKSPNTSELNQEYSGPGGVVVDEEGHVYVADTWNHRIAVFDSEGQYQEEWKADFWGPRDVTVFGDKVIVADTGKNRLVILNREGMPLQTVGEEGTAEGQFKEPVGVAAHRGEIFVADTGNTRIQVFGPNLEFRRGFPVAGWEDVVGTEPYLAFGSRGSLWVTDSGNSRVQKFSPDGRLLAIFGPQVEGGTPLKNAKGIAGGPGFLLLSDFGNQRLLKWSP